MFGANGFGQTYFGQIQPAAATASLAATTTIRLAVAAALSVPAPLAASATIRLSTTATFASAAFASTSTISVAAAARLSVPAPLAAASGFGVSTTANLRAVTRFAASAGLHLEAVATLAGSEALHASRVRILLAGVEARARVAGLTIRDVINDAPNSCQLTIDGAETPLCEQTLRVMLGALPVSAPATPPGLALAPGGGLGVGTYRYTYVFVTARGSTLSSPVATITTTAGNQTVVVTLPSGPSGTLYAVVYRTVVNGAALLLLQTPNVPITFSDTAGDGSLNPAYTPPLTDTAGLYSGQLLFNGALQTVNLSYEGLPEQIAYPCAAIDDTARANRMRPFGAWTNLSATVVAQQLIAQFAPGFTVNHVQPNLPPVTILLDGTEGMSGALTQVTQQIGGYFYFEDTDLHLFIEEITQAPDPIDGTPGRLLDDPPIAIMRDDSQLRTRQYGRGHGEQLLADVLAGETILPVANADAWFNAPGSQRRAIALAQRLTYGGVQGGGGGSMVGPGAAPTTAMNLAVVAGAGLGTGLYKYAFTAVTAAGESLPSPLASVAVGIMSPPTTAPAIGAPTAGAGPDTGTHVYAASFVTPTGETAPGPVSASVVTGAIPINPPSSAPTITETGSSDIGWNGHYHWRVSFMTAAGETTVGPSGDWTAVPARFVSLQVSVAVGPSGTTGRHLWLTSDEGPTIAQFYIPDNVTTVMTFVSNADYNSKVIYGQVFPPSNTAGSSDVHVVPLSAIPLGPSGTTARRLYRTAANSAQLRYLLTLNDNTTNQWLDGSTDGQLGGNAPTVGTATANQVSIFYVPIAPGATTARKIYRTLVNGSALKFWGTMPDNVSTNAGLDPVPDSAIVGNASAPVADTSGLTQPSGQVNAGATAIPTASAAPFFATGGWALLGSGQAVRYTGLSGNTLIGVPASGSGALLTTVLFGQQALPAPALIGVAGVNVPIVKGTPVCIWVQRDDTAAQAEQAAVDAANGIVPADGIYEGPPLVDERRNEASMSALCDANLAQYARPIVTVVYACRDVKTKSGKTIVIDLDSPAIHEELTIQEVTITEIDIAPGLLPRFSVTASSTRFSLDDILRRLLTSSDAQTG